MHPSSLLSYYPTYAILDEIVAKNNYDMLNIFIDFKNTLQSTYMEHAVVNIVESTKKSKFIDTSVFSSLISFLSFHKMWSIKRGIDLNFFVFFDVGHSYYHKNISKKYKISRRIDDLYGLDSVDRDLFYSVLNANFELVRKACNRMPGIQVIKLNNLESDFIPYYLLTRDIVIKHPTIAQVIYSNDHDLWQCVGPDTYIFSKVHRKKSIIKAGKIMSRYLKEETDILDEYLPLAMSVIGDPGDDVDGIEGIGIKTFLKIFYELQELLGTMDEIYKKVENNDLLFSPIPTKVRNKQVKRVVDEEIKNKTISNNLKLVSFELISRALESPNTTEMLQRRKGIIDVIQGKKSIAQSEKMKDALERSGVYLEEASIDFLYI